MREEKSTDPLVVIVLGPPSAGKTTLGRRLAADLRLPFFNKDGIKERLFESLGWQDRDWSNKLGRASIQLLLYLINVELLAGQSFVVESNFWKELAEPEFLALKRRYEFRTLQILCTASEAVLLQRFKDRDASGERHPGHVDKQLYHELPEILRTRGVQFLDIGGEVIKVDTTDFARVDYDDLLRKVRELALSV